MNLYESPKSPVHVVGRPTRTDLALIRAIVAIHIAFAVVILARVFVEHVLPSHGVNAVYDSIGFVIVALVFLSLACWISSSLWRLKRWARVFFIIWDSLWVALYVGGFLYVFGILKTTPDPYDFFSKSAGALFAASSLIVLTRTRAFVRRT